MKVRDVANFVRSKNAGPFNVTFDVMFDNSDDLQRAVDSGAFAKHRIAEVYGGIDEEPIKIFVVPAALAIKITIPRRIQAGDFGDGDMAAGQQFAPLLDLDI